MFFKKKDVDLGTLPPPPPPFPSLAKEDLPDPETMGIEPPDSNNEKNIDSDKEKKSKKKEKHHSKLHDELLHLEKEIIDVAKTLEKKLGKKFHHDEKYKTPKKEQKKANNLEDKENQEEARIKNKKSFSFKFFKKKEKKKPKHDSFKELDKFDENSFKPEEKLPITEQPETINVEDKHPEIKNLLDDMRSEQEILDKNLFDKEEISRAIEQLNKNKIIPDNEIPTKKIETRPMEKPKPKKPILPKKQKTQIKKQIHKKQEIQNNKQETKKDTKKLTGVKKIDHMIHDARNFLMEFNLSEAKIKYIEIMREYNTLTPEDKAAVHHEINDLYNERKSAESLNSKYS